MYGIFKPIKALLKYSNVNRETSVCGGGLRGGARRDLRPRSTTSVRFCVSVKTFADLGFGSGPQLLQFLGSSFNGRGRSQQLVLCNDSGVLGVHPLGACNTQQQQQTLSLGKS